MKHFLILLLFLFIFLISFSVATAQSLFPQKDINSALDSKYHVQPLTSQSTPGNVYTTGWFSLMKQLPAMLDKMNAASAQGVFSSMNDTIFVGEVPADTLMITGTFFNNGPILVFNDGVLIFDQANATILGDLYVFQNGKLFCDSSVINCPQQYFYQRSLVIANNGYVNISNTTLDFGGLSHNLAVVENGEIVMNNITNIGFTTAGGYGNASITIDGTNQAGEFIMTDSCSFNFSNANTVLLWHHIPQGGTIDVSFPSGVNVATYNFNNAQPGVSGIGYSTQVTNCTHVMWALMPENGSDVIVSASSLRAIGLWFTGTDTSSVSGLVNNSSYTNFTAPLSDRNLQLNSTSVQTWSLYLFNSTVMNVTGSIVGEVGSMGTSQITAQGILCDGSGGYYWANDTSLSIAVNTTVLGYMRSQGNGIVLIGYGSTTSGASATGNSVMVVTQSSLPQDPVAYEHGTVWRVHINSPQNLYVDTIITITGSAFVDQGPLGSFMAFGTYSVEYAPTGVQGWIPIITGVTGEVYNGFLGQWNTDGLTPGNYLLRLNTLNNFGDSIDAVIQITLLPSVLSLEENDRDVKLFTAHYNSQTIYVNSLGQLNGNALLTITDIAGKIVYQATPTVKERLVLEIPFIKQSPGNYYLQLSIGKKTYNTRVFVD